MSAVYTFRCCVAVPIDQHLDLDLLAKTVEKRLPKYAWPLFVRRVAASDVTGNLKFVKTSLKQDGINPDKTSDPVYWLQNGRYVPFGPEDYKAIQAGQVKL